MSAPISANRYNVSSFERSDPWEAERMLERTGAAGDRARRPSTVTVVRGDTLWKFWEERERHWGGHLADAPATWSDFKTWIIDNNSALAEQRGWIDEDGHLTGKPLYLQPGDELIVARPPAVPRPPAPTPSPGPELEPGLPVPSSPRPPPSDSPVSPPPPSGPPVLPPPSPAPLPPYMVVPAPPAAPPPTEPGPGAPSQPTSPTSPTTTPPPAPGSDDADNTPASSGDLPTLTENFDSAFDEGMSDGSLSVEELNRALGHVKLARAPNTLTPQERVEFASHVIGALGTVVGPGGEFEAAVRYGALPTVSLDQVILTEVLPLLDGQIPSATAAVVSEAASLLTESRGTDPAEHETLRHHLGNAIVNSDSGGLLYKEVIAQLRATQASDSLLIELYEQSAANAVNQLSEKVQYAYEQYDAVAQRELADLAYFLGGSQNLTDDQIAKAVQAYEEANPSAVTAVGKASDNFAKATADATSRLLLLSDAVMPVSNDDTNSVVQRDGRLFQSITEALKTPSHTLAMQAQADQFVRALKEIDPTNIPKAMDGWWAVTEGRHALWAAHLTAVAAKVPAIVNLNHPTRLGLGSVGALTILNGALAYHFGEAAFQQFAAGNGAMAGHYASNSFFMTEMTALYGMQTAQRLGVTAAGSALRALTPGILNTAMWAFAAAQGFNVFDIMTNPYRQNSIEYAVAGLQGVSLGVGTYGMLTAASTAAVVPYLAAVATISTIAFGLRQPLLANDYRSRIEDSTALPKLFQSIGIRDELIPTLTDVGAPFNHGLDIRSTWARINALAQAAGTPPIDFINSYDAEELRRVMNVLFAVEELDDGTLLVSHEDDDDDEQAANWLLSRYRDDMQLPAMGRPSISLQSVLMFFERRNAPQTQPAPNGNESESGPR